VNLHDKKVNTVHLEPAAERELASSCSDGTVALWDVRKLSAGAMVSAHYSLCTPKPAN